MKRFHHGRRIVFFALGWALLGAGSAHAEPLPFRRAVELAVSRASATGVEAANRLRAQSAYRQARSAYLPQAVVGSGLGWSYGYPLSIEGSAPSVFNVNYQSVLYSPAQREFVRSAKIAWEATESATENERRNVLLETSVSYVQLNTVAGRTKSLEEQLQVAAQLVKLVTARVHEGVDPQIELTRARLAEARARMTLADARGAMGVLRERLSQLTGVPVDSIETVSESIPEVPDATQEEGLVAKALASSETLKLAEQQARSKEFRARGEHKQLYPSMDAVGQYGLFSRFNNYDQFFQKFQRNNATVGVAIRFPFLNFAQRQAAEAADAETLLARRQVEQTRNQISTQTLQMAQAVQQLNAAEEVAQLEYQLAQAQVEATQTRLEGPGTGSPGTAPNPRDLQLARIDAGQRYGAFVDTSFELKRARLQLLRAIGRLENWALGN
ncbi:MAG TPA: TolC family protein [Terriglobales bacterium]|nr:TolC family protein [Terriglobales bacterium]